MLIKTKYIQKNNQKNKIHTLYVHVLRIASLRENHEQKSLVHVLYVFNVIMTCKSNFVI